MTKSELTLLQRQLQKKQLYIGAIDGKRGPKTLDAVIKWLASQQKLIDSGWQQWSDKRQLVAALQLMCQSHGIDAGAIDGWHGPQTAAAVTLLKQLARSGNLSRSFDDIEPLNANPDDFPIERVDQLTAYYGKPGKVPLTKVHCPWLLHLDWDRQQTTQTISIHKRLGDNLAELLADIHSHYGDQEIKRLGLHRYGGSYNPRKKRGSQTAWSTHAWGIAIDWFPSRNKMQWRSDRASLAKPELDYFWQCWEQRGWLSLGRTEDRDWMHIQAAKR